MLPKQIQDILDNYAKQYHCKDWLDFKMKHTPSSIVSIHFDQLLILLADSNIEKTKEAFNAGKEEAYHYDKTGISTGYYPKWDSFEQWQKSLNK